MSKTLQTIQTLSKIAKVLSKIAMIFFIVGAALSLAGIVTLAMGVDTIAKLGSVNIRGIIQNEAGLSTGQLYIAISSGMIACIGGAITAGCAARYFTHELEAGTPFTFEGAKEMLRLGIIAVAVPIATGIVAGTVRGILEHFFATTWESELYGSSSVGMGVLFIAASLIFKYGAELAANRQ